jgi:hypothetical protein
MKKKKIGQVEFVPTSTGKKLEIWVEGISHGTLTPKQGERISAYLFEWLDEIEFAS